MTEKNQPTEGHEGLVARCPDWDQVVEVCRIMGSDSSASIRHLLSCEACRDSLEMIDLIQDAYEPDGARVEALASRVLDGADVDRPRWITVWLDRGLATATWAMATTTVTWGALLVSEGVVVNAFPWAIAVGVVTGFLATRPLGRARVPSRADSLG